MTSRPTGRRRTPIPKPIEHPGTRGPIAALLAAVAAVGLVLSAGCGYTASPALLPAHLKTVAIPVFENGTPEAALEQEVTDAVVRRFVQDNHLRIVDEKSANAILRGRIVSYKNSVYGFTSDAQSNSYRVSIGVQVTFKDLVKNREVWSDEILKSVNYYVQEVPGQKPTTELDGRKDAIAKLADEILSRSVEGW